MKVVKFASGPIFRWVWIAIFLTLPGCGTPGGNGQLSTANSQSPTAAPAPLLPSPSSPPLLLNPAPTIPPAPLLPSTPAPSPTPTPLILAVPPQWVAPLVALPPLWQTLQTDEPATALANGQADAALVHDASGILIQQTALALTVPFTMDWHDITLERAQEILTAGHPEVVVLPWAEMKPDRRALRVDGSSPADPDYPLQDTWSLLANNQTAYFDALAATLQGQFSADPVVHLAAVGDLMLDRSLGWYVQRGDLAYPFAPVADLLRAADLTIGNLECALGDIGTPAAKSYTFRAPPEAAQALALAGFDIVNLANNHAMDFGPDALQQGLSLLTAAGIATIGAGNNALQAHQAYIETVNGLSLAFLGYVHVPVEAISGFDTASWTAGSLTPGLAWAAPGRIKADVTAVSPKVDLVIVSLHSGYEYVEAPSPPQMAAARAAIDAGADVVLGHHAHILQGIEFYGDGVIVYGLGNFAFEIDGPPETAVLNLWLDGDGVRELEIIPAILQFGGQPRLAETWEASPIYQRVHYLTTLLTPQ